MRLRAASALLLLLCLSGRSIDAGTDITTVTAGPDTDAANNDFRRLQDAINAAAPGDTIVLSGTFDFSAPFAAAAWAFGNDGTPGTGDDYSVYIPGGKNNVTLTATALGDATIQGPGDLAAINLEGFLYFATGDNQDWTISNLQIYDFDLAIGMFASSGDAFNGTRIENNVIRIPRDLNATVAPVDVNQNIGIHFSFGANQSILNNTIQLPGDGVSDSGNATFSSSVGMQSNISGGAVYNGLTISGNAVHVLNAQSADPETMIGIWENGFAHTSTITVANNSFVNDAPGNDPALNLQRAFRVTSHSSATTTVTYESNQVDGATVGFQWIAGANFTGSQPVVLRGNQITNSATGILIQSEGVAHLTGNVITGSGSGGGLRVVTGTLAGFGANTNGVSNTTISGGSGDGIWITATASGSAPITLNDLSGNAGVGLRNDAVSTIDATRNWWGSNLAAAAAAEVSGDAPLDPWLASGSDVSPNFAFQPFIWATTSSSVTFFFGTSAADTASLLAGDPVTMTLNGETATTALAQLLYLDVRLGDSDDVFTNGQSAVPVVFTGGAGNDTLVGSNAGHTWTVMSGGAGELSPGTTSFLEVETLRGGTAADTFTFASSGSLAQGIDGGLGSDSLDNTAITGHTTSPASAGSLDGFAGSASGVPAFDNINTIAGTSADLSVQKVGPSSAFVNAAITYTITVSNAGPDAALGATLSDPLPPGTTFASLVATAGWSCLTPPSGGTGTVTCTRPVTPVGTSTFTLVVNAPATAGDITNTASVSSAADTIPANDSDVATTGVIAQADLAVTKSGPASAAAGTDVTYTITVSNNGPHAATSVSLTDPLPAGTTFVSLQQDAGPAFSCTPGATVTCMIATLANGASATFSLTANIPATAPAGTLSNTASVSTSATDPDTLNDSATAETTIAPSADLAIGMTGPASGVAGGSNLVYTITVTNNGPSDAAGVSVADLTPAGLTFVSNAGGCATPYPCALGTIAAGASQVITTTMASPASFSGLAASNIATVTATTSDPSSADNSATVTTVIARSADLAITMTGPASGVAGGSNLVFIVTVTNNGPSDAAGVGVATVTPGLTFVGNTGACITSYPCALGTIAPGGSQVITTTMAIPASFPGVSAASMATVTAATSDPSVLNNSASVTTSVSCTTLALSPSAPRLAVLGRSYSETFTLVDGLAPVTFGVTGSLPPGLSLSGAVLSGTPTERGAFAFTLNATDARGCSASFPLTLAVSRGRLITVGQGPGGVPLVRQFAPNQPPVAGPLGEFDAFASSFSGGVSVASGDTNGDGVADVIAGAGDGGAPLINVFNGADGGLRLSFLAFPASLSAGVEVAAGDVNGDGFADIIAAPGFGGPPLVRVFDGRTGAVLREGFAMATDWIGGLHVGAGDLNGDGFADIITGAGPGGAPLVQVFDGASGLMVSQFLAYAPAFPGGVYVAAGDVNGDGFADIVTGAGPSGGPHVRVFDGLTNEQIPGVLGGFFAYSPAFVGGVRVAAGDIDGDGVAEVITGAGPGGGPHVRVFDGASGVEVSGFFAFDGWVVTGTFVSGPPNLPRMVIDIPQPGAAVTSNVRVAGWALEESSVAAPGIDAVHVWAYPVGGGAPTFVGATTAFGPRPDVAALMGGDFLRSGFDVTGTLPAGTYDLVVFVRNAVTRVFDNRRVVRITVQ